MSLKLAKEHMGIQENHMCIVTNHMLVKIFSYNELLHHPLS